MGVGKTISLIASYRVEMVKIGRAAKLRAWRANFLLKLKSPFPPFSESGIPGQGHWREGNNIVQNAVKRYGVTR